jgi:MIP family channel proteins
MAAPARPDNCSPRWRNGGPRADHVGTDGARLIAEAVGTFFLVFIGAGAAMVNAWTGGGLGVTGVSLAFAFVVTAMLYALGRVSGAHINPAITIGLWSARRFPTRAVVPYVVAQCTGGVAASIALRGVLGPIGHMGATLPAIGLSGAFAVEWLLSFILMLVIMAVATDDDMAPGVAAMAIGLAVGCCAIMGGPLTGASMNPARSFGPALVGGLWHAHWVYWSAPITGMTTAARLHAWWHPCAPG